MMRTWIALVMLVVAPTLANAQYSAPAAGQNSEQGAPGSAGGKGDGTAVQHGAQPNAGEVRPGNRDGDAPSASAGNLVSRADRRIFGLPVSAALVLGAAIIAIVVVAGVVLPASRRRERARGNGTYGRP
jgi:hypothetical protein